MAQLMAAGAGTLARRLASCRRAGAATEFALVGIWAVGLMFILLNLAMLSYSLNTLARGVQAAARQAIVIAGKNSTGDGGSPPTQSFTGCPAPAAIAGYFNAFDNHGLPAAGITAASNPYINASWSYSAGDGLGL